VRAAFYAQAFTDKQNEDLQPENYIEAREKAWGAPRAHD